EAGAGRQRPVVQRRERDRGRRLAAGEHVGAVGGERQLEERAGERRARLDEREEGAGGEIEALQHPLLEGEDLAQQPVVAVAAAAAARARERAANSERGTASPTRRHSAARCPFTPSGVDAKKSARSRRTFRLSTTRVSPPVPGSTPRSVTSGSDTAAAPSSTSRISSQASASS